MSRDIGEEKVAYIQPSETTWCVQIRDGTGLSDGLFTIPQRYYHESVEEAKEAAQRYVESGKVDRFELSVVAKRELVG